MHYSPDFVSGWVSTELRRRSTLSNIPFERIESECRPYESKIIAKYDGAKGGYTRKYIHSMVVYLWRSGDAELLACVAG
jgi:hypothetical protein